MRLLITLTVLIVFVSCDSIKFKKQVLYDVYAQPAASIKTKQEIFTEGQGLMWNSLFNCGNFEITQEDAYTGKSSIKLSWNKASCEWIGFGNSFNNWQPVDLSKDRFKKALSFYVRTQSKTAKAIPIVANLEDYSGGGSYYFIDANKYLVGLEMDTTWKQIIVPLWDFPVIEDEFDVQSVKQMKFQLEGAGSFYLDDIKIIDYSKEEFNKMRAEVELMKPKGELNQIVYTEGRFTEDAWGYTNNSCQGLSEKTDSAGNTFIHWTYNSTECNWSKWGMNWNGWYAINFRGIDNMSSISVKIKADKTSKFKMFIEDFKGHKAEVFTSTSQNFNSESWTEVSIPLKNLNLSEKGFVLDQMKQVYFTGTNQGEVLIDDIKITN
ncbi:hypothetical protein OAD28_05455 [Flavobacteriales bacterium]|nr:hypothetical protein [Flavobacteriales bacterium]